MKSLEQIRDMLCEELDGMASMNRIDKGSLEVINKMTDTIKNIDKIRMLEEQSYSYDGSSRRSYDGMSRGSYGSYGSYDGSNRGSRARSRMSRAGDEEIVERMQSVMEEGNFTQEERAALMKAISTMR